MITVTGFRMADTPNRSQLGPDSEITPIWGDGQRFASDPLSDPSTAYLGSNINKCSLPDLSYLHGLLPSPLGRPSDLISPPARLSINRHDVPLKFSTSATFTVRYRLFQDAHDYIRLAA
jgi:hypothetical protein